MNKKSRSDFTRRDFVKSSSAVIAGSAFAIPAFARSVHVGHTDTIRVGLVGCGGRGTGAAQQAMNADENVILTAMGDAFIDKIEWSKNSMLRNERITKKIQVQDTDCYTGFDAYKQVIDSGVDFVILTTPPVFRPEHLAYAISKGKHVFAEKPVAIDGPGIRSVLQTCREAKEKGLAVMSGFCWRHSDPQRETYGRIQNGQIGDIRAIQSTYNTGPLGDYPRTPEMTDGEWQLRNWKAFIHLSGDHIVEQAVHAIDWIHWTMKDETPVRVYAVGGRQARTGEWTGNMYDHFGVTYEFANGARGYHMCRQIANCANDNTAFIMGTKGTCSNNPWAPRCIIDGDDPWRYKGRKNDMYQTEHNELFASIRAGEPINDGQWMCDSTMMAIIGREAAYTGQAITWDQMLNSKKSWTPKDWDWGDAEFPQVPVPGVTKFE